MSYDLTKLPEDEWRSLVDVEQCEAVRLLADIMQLNGAGVMTGDVLQGLARLGLRFVSVDDGEVGKNAEIRAFTLTERQDCACDGVWVRLKDNEGTGGGWWHQRDNEHFARKCPNGNRKPKGLIQS